MKKQKKRSTYTNGQVFLLCSVVAIVAIVAFLISIYVNVTLGTPAVLKVDTLPISENTPSQEPESAPSITQNTPVINEPSSELPTTKTDKDIIMLTPSSEPLYPDSQNTSTKPDTKDEPSTSADTTETLVETDEEIMQNPSSRDRFDSIVDRQALYEAIKALYLIGEWNGEPMVFDGHYITLSSDGYICANTYMLLHSRENLDIPLNFDDKHIMDDCNFCYIPGHGTYIVDDETYFRCYKGKSTKLGKIADWKEGTGVDVDYKHPIIYYDEVNDKLFLWSPMIYSYKETYDYNYLYYFPDYDIAKIEFIAQVKCVDFDEKGFKFTDMNGVTWRYENKDGKDCFVNSVD